MKRFFVIVVLFVALIFSVAACSKEKTEPEDSEQRQPTTTQVPNAEAVLSGKITHMYDDSILLAGTGAYDLYMISSVVDIYDANNQVIDTSALKAGQKVEIGYSGAVMESYPAQLGTPVYIKIIEQSEDMVGFYQTVINDLWNVDAGLNSDISLIAFDLSELSNLTDAEKSSLVYIVSSTHGLQGLSGTFDELSQQGYIDKENLYFEKGILFQFELGDVMEDSFTFHATKWRSGLGAFYFHKCKAVKTDDGWTYTIGSEMIS